MSIKDVMSKIANEIKDGFNKIDITKTDLNTIKNSKEAKEELTMMIDDLKFEISMLDWTDYETYEPTTEELINEYNRLIDIYNNKKQEDKN